MLSWLTRPLRGLRAQPPPRERGPAHLPRTIWMLWLQGWDEAPELVGACARTWRRCNPGWELRLIAQDDLPSLIGDDAGMRAIAGKQLPPGALSDVVRLAILLRHGGVWADATTYCLRPLDDWLPPMLVSGFFAFTNYEPDRMIASWFLAAEPGSRLLAIWRTYVAAYWRRRTLPHTYFWFHGFLFGKAHRQNREFRAIWKATPTLSSRGSAQLASRLGEPLPDAQWAAITGAGVPLLKLRHRRGGAPAGPQSVYRKLVDRALDDAESA